MCRENLKWDVKPFPFCTVMRSFSNVLRSAQHTCVEAYIFNRTHRHKHENGGRGFYLKWCIYKLYCHLHALIQTHTAWTLHRDPPYFRCCYLYLKDHVSFALFPGLQVGSKRYWMSWAINHTHTHTHTYEFFSVINTQYEALTRKQTFKENVAVNFFILHHKKLLWHYIFAGLHYFTNG